MIKLKNILNEDKTNWVLDKIKKDISQMKYNLKKVGLEKTSIYNSLKDVEKTLEDYYD